MKPIPINLGVEDLLSEAVARRLLAASGQQFAVGVVFNRGGYGYLRRTAVGWNRAANSVPFFLLTDLDARACPSALLEDWFPFGIHRNMIARVAIREVEAWLLADSYNLSRFLGVARNSIPEDPETLADPKLRLVQLAATSPRHDIKRRIVPKTHSTAKQGPDYNSCLTEFVNRQFDPERAAKISPSLRRCLQRLRAFAPTWLQQSPL
jgi:hypothetical protein